MKKSRLRNVWDLTSLIRHLGSAHNRLENYLPKEFCLPRSSIGNFLKVPTSTEAADPVSDNIGDQIFPEDDLTTEDLKDSAVGNESVER